MASPTAPKYLIVVTGPTAVGKTALCIDLALRLGTEIVSADARQCYQGMAIGTAQPTTTELQAVPHHLVNFLPVQTPYSAGQYAQDALRTLAMLFAKYDHVLMTGGSGLYIQAVCEGLDAMPPVVPTIRAALNERLQKEGVGVLAADLATQDPDYYQIVDRANPQRVIRALEVCLATGQPYSSFHRRQPTARPFTVIKIGLTRDRSELYRRIDERVEQMLVEGLLEEATALYPYRAYNALQTVGYRELFGYLAGHYDQAEAIRLLKRNTRRYAKRQLTWLVRDEGIRWFHPDEGEAILAYIHQRTSSAP
ncbi:MAG: tRNA (adenosine(37)-N6)-dimethylallyltransferase MiaA [Bacteroidota bacterium]